ncbi:MAG TPA: carboxypeptidase-like regulatory domain-containing protein, partial [Armatimonadota bacterium]|nr:carboxypeptidase-like regulatory domain-containing protein [Armatimonadota bacterium]
MQKLRALFLGLALLPLLGAQAPPTRPDLDVAFISFTPRYPAYEVHYPDGLPQSLHPETGKPLVAEDADAVQRWPRKGELVTATARVVNHGGAPSGPFLYTWLVNGKKVAEGRHAGLAAECMALPQTVEWKLKGRTFRVAPLRPESVVELTYPFKWRRPGYSLELRVRPETAGLEEISAENNSRVERTDALGLAVLIHRRAYNEWARTPGPLGTYSFEDWVQHQVELLRRKFADAIYPSAPRGVEQAIRIDTIRVLADGEDAAAFEAVAAVNGWDGVWSYGPERRTEATQDATAADGALFDELGRQLGLIDLEVLSVRPEANAVRDALTGQPVGVGYRLPVPALTRSPAEVSLPEHSVLALNRLKGQRRGYRGTYLYDIPRSCRVRVLDNNGRPVPEADVSVYQAERGEVRPEPVAAGRTSADGVYALPNRPAPAVETETGATLRANPFGKILV